MERVALFKRRFPYTHITVYKIRKLYRLSKIKKKLVRVGKVLPSRAASRALDDVLNLADDVRAALVSGYRLLQVDEAVYTKRTLLKSDWSKKL